MEKSEIGLEKRGGRVTETPAFYTVVNRSSSKNGARYRFHSSILPQVDSFNGT